MRTVLVAWAEVLMPLCRKCAGGTILNDIVTDRPPPLMDSIRYVEWLGDNDINRSDSNMSLWLCRPTSARLARCYGHGLRPPGRYRLAAELFRDGLP